MITMNEGNKTPRKFDESAKPIAATNAARPSGWRKLLAKRWVFPAVYMAAAAIIVTILWLNAGTGQKDPGQAVNGREEVASESPEAVEVAAGAETLRWPVDKLDEMETVVPYYDTAAPAADREAAMIEQGDTFTPHMAVDLARKDAQPFDVLAAMSGKVTVAEQTADEGYEVRIEHANGLMTVYRSLADVRVQIGDEVAQGDVLAVSGQGEHTPGEGAHVHFEVLNNGQSVNPGSLIAAE